jgi:tetratricopeptide (TPR) repeat protein
MKSSLLPVALLAFLTATLAFRIKENHRSSSALKVSVLNKQQAIRCSPDWNSLSEWLEEYDIPPFPGAGTYAWKISTNNDSARFYFNQGISMYYSFHIIEAMASFKKAVRFDPSSGMLYWAQALAYGPNINDLGYAASPEALLAVKKAKEFSATCTPDEKELINAMSVRYTPDSADINRKQLNEKYTAAMARLYAKYPAHADIAALYADAMMLEHPWDLWNPDGTAKTWTPRIRQVLEKLLQKTPQHPGANHYYIHVMEPSPFASKALASANRLGKLTPGLSHTVHMPSHIYLRTGLYDQGVAVNEQAVKSYEQSIPLYAPVTGADFLYLIHNLHMQVNNAMMAGRAAYSAETANALVKSIPPDYLNIPGAMGNLVQYIYMTPVLVDIRFGHWKSLLERKEPSPGQVYARILWLFGRGMAMAHTNDLPGAVKLLSEMETLSADSVLKLPFTPFSPAVDGAVIAMELLRGTIYLKQAERDKAVTAFRKAVTTEAGMVYNEPRDWLLNPRHFLADACIKKGDYKEAERTIGADLAVNNENGWSLFGYWQLLNAQHKTAAASQMKARFKKAFAKADIELSGPVY